VKGLGERVVPETRLLNLDRVGIADSISLCAVWHGKVLQHSPTVPLDKLCVDRAHIELCMGR
jgi:hypothetical protein